MGDATRPRPFIHSPFRGRIVGFGASFLGALLVVLFAPAWIRGLERVVAAYDIAALTLVIVLFRFGMHAHPRDTECRAAVEDPGGKTVVALVLVSVVGALASAVSIIGKGPHETVASEKTFIYLIGVGAIFLGWFLIHVLFTFRYAHLYYFDDDGDNEADRGLKFPGTNDPNDYDFAYFSFVIGMTFQVSDVEITDPGVRRYVLFHALVSFAYNTTIIALVVNLASSLIGH
jgi:uncharacterized membrane protein